MISFKDCSKPGYELSPTLNIPYDFDKKIQGFLKKFKAAIIRSEVRGIELHIWMDPKICECDLRADMPIYIWAMRLLLQSWSSEMHKVTQIVGHVRDCGNKDDVFGKYVVNPLDYVAKTEGGYHICSCHDVVDILGLLTWVAD